MNRSDGILVDIGLGLDLNLGSVSRYRENAISGNATGTVTGGGVNAGNDVCNGLLTCP